MFSDVPSVLWHCWLGGRKVIRPVKNWVVRCWRGCLGWDADLHVAQQMPLPLTISCSSKSRLVLTFLVYLSGTCSPGWSRTYSRRAVKWFCVCVVRKGVAQSEVAELFNVNRCTVYRIVRGFETTNNLENLPKSGHPNLLSDRDKRSLLQATKRDRSTPLAEVTAKFNQHPWTPEPLKGILTYLKTTCGQ